MSESYADRLLDAALAYAKQGIAVFPVSLGVRGENKKDVRPIDEWKEASTTDPEIITSWYRGRWAGTTIAIDCGKSGLVVADGDVSDGKSGPDNWEALRPAPTARVRTPSGGIHDFYREDPEHPVSVDNRGAVADGVDVRGQGGFVFAAPSADPRGGSWEWEKDVPRFDALPVVPRVLTERVEQAQANKRVKAERREVREEYSSAIDERLFGTSATPYVGNGKTLSAALELLKRETDDFIALTEPGSGRSHILSQRLAVLAGHGVGVFWGEQQALDILIDACRENGFIDEHGEAYAWQQAERGLEYGMREPWEKQEEPRTIDDEVRNAEPDEVDALIAEMISPEEIALRPAPRPLIRGLLNLDSESWIIGEPGSKKSFVAADMAGHVARGMPWQGLKVTQAKVIMIIAEGAGGMSSRIKAWEQAYGPMGSEVRILPRPVQAKNTKAWGVLVAACARLGAGMIVVDTQARVTVGLEENSATEMGIYVEAVRALREATGACVLTVHHTGRKGGDARGSSAIDGAQHTELKVESKGLRGKLSVEKQKDMESRAPMRLLFRVIDLGVDEEGERLTSLVLDGDAWSMAVEESADSEALEVPGQEVRVSEPEPWTFTLFDHAKQDMQRRILQVIKETAGTAGRSEAQIQRAVAERWYGGRIGRVKGDLNEQTWSRAWTRVLACGAVISGEVSGFALDPDRPAEADETGS